MWLYHHGDKVTLHRLWSQHINVNEGFCPFDIFIILYFDFIEMDGNFDVPELMGDDNAVDDYDDDDGNNVAEEVEVKWCKIMIC